MLPQHPTLRSPGGGPINPIRYSGCRPVLLLRGGLMESRWIMEQVGMVGLDARVDGGLYGYAVGGVGEVRAIMSNLGIGCISTLTSSARTIPALGLSSLPLEAFSYSNTNLSFVQ
jgi:hypothetical protein